MQNLIDKNNALIKKLRGNPYTRIIAIVKNNQYIKDFILHNIYQRITQHGTDSYGDKLRTDKARGGSEGTAYGKAYSPHHPTKSGNSHVNLYETGTMFNTMKVVVSKNEINVNVNLTAGKDSSVYENFKVSYATEKDFKDIVFSLDDSEINNLNNILLNELEKEYKTAIAEY